MVVSKDENYHGEYPMTSNIIPLGQAQHGDLKLRQLTNFSHVKNEHVIPVVVHEFIQASSEYPVVFVKNSDNGQFIPVVMLGLKPGENLFAGEDGWRGLYIPTRVRTHPFHLMRNPHDHDQLMMAIDENATVVGKEEGDALFNDDGTESAYLERRKKQLTDYFESGQLTEAFTALMAELDLLVPRSLSLEIRGESISLDGVYFIDEAKLNALSDDVFSDLRKRGFLPLVYAQMMSVHQVQRLASIKAKL
tara:strand:+ start:2096 stop:2842 length:747 start_codon:yes stop_codon:yes gene_type:complete